MHKFSRYALFALMSGLLAACGGGSGTMPSSPGVPATEESAQGSHVSARATESSTAFLRLADTGRWVHYFPTRSNAAQHAAAIPPPASNLIYGGGDIQPSGKVYVVFWGKEWNTKDPDGVATLLKNFYGGWNGASWPGTLTQYYGPSGTYIADTTTLAGTWVDTGSTPGLHPTDAGVGKEATRGASHFGDYSIDASYVVAIPTGHDPSGFATEWCAWHDDESAGGGTIQYTDLPYMPDGGSSCGSGSVNSPGTNDGVTIVSGHEQAETESDPRPCSGWCDSGGNEIADKCAWEDLQNTAFTNGTYPTQPLWSNKKGGCAQ